KEFVADAVRDNRELRVRLAELEALPKNDELFPERLKDLQKVFRQHARDDKRELLPAVQRALSEEQVQGVAEKMEAGLAEAGQAPPRIQHRLWRGPPHLPQAPTLDAGPPDPQVWRFGGPAREIGRAHARLLASRQLRARLPGAVRAVAIGYPGARPFLQKLND